MGLSDEQHGTIGECLSCQDGREFYQPGSVGIHYLCFIQSPGGVPPCVHPADCCPDRSEVDRRGPKTTVPLTGPDSLKAVLFSFLEPT